MFEQSLAVSDAGRGSAESRWTWAGSTVLQACLAVALIAVPMFRPERLRMVAAAPKALVPLDAAKPREVKVRRVEASAAPRSGVAAVSSAPRTSTAPATVPHGIGAGDPPPLSTLGSLSGPGSGLPEGLAEGVPTAAVRVAVAPVRGPVRVSSGVAAGMLMTPIRPVYPQIARAARVEGAVVLEATISREGRLERARVVSGPAMLAGAALEAVRGARYTPYHLNGEVVEVETTITVNFRIGG